MIEDIDNTINTVKFKGMEYGFKTYYILKVLMNEFHIVNNVYQAQIIYDDMVECEDCNVEPVPESICDYHRQELKDGTDF